MNDELKLKPCPFCGHDDITVEGKVKNFIYKDGTPMRGMWYDAQCEYCGCSLGPSPSMEMLIENWNRRAFDGYPLSELMAVLTDVIETIEWEKAQDE